MKTLKHYILCALALPLLGCSSFLDVNPKGEVFDKDMFESAEGYEDALYGIYAELGTQKSLYSDYMFWVPETLSINVTLSDDGMSNMAIGEWSRTHASTIRNDIWSAAYKVINHINNIVSHIEKGGDHEFRHTPLYKGEALALRALLHFDMLRMYGAPIWADEASKARAIPYVSKYSFDITAFSSLDEAYEKVIADLKEAEKCLAEDETLVEPVRTNASDGGFTSCRIIHMNLYAVQALLARVYWSKNDLENAAIYAKKVIDSGKFGFRPVTAFNQPDNGALDLNETIFGIYSTESQKKNASKYQLDGKSTDSNFTMASDYRSLYLDGSSSSQTDYRLAAWFDEGLNTLRRLVSPSYYTSDKPSYTGKSILGINMIRIPEMYYIMAEALLESDPDTASDYFDAVIKTRGLDALGEQGHTVTADALYIERRKEFYGEGQQWFNMKRLGKDIVATSTITLSGSDVNTYKIPLPKDEEDNREE